MDLEDGEVNNAPATQSSVRNEVNPHSSPPSHPNDSLPTDSARDVDRKKDKKSKHRSHHENRHRSPDRRSPERGRSRSPQHRNRRDSSPRRKDIRSDHDRNSSGNTRRDRREDNRSSHRDDRDDRRRNDRDRDRDRDRRGREDRNRDRDRDGRGRHGPPESRDRRDQNGNGTVKKVSFDPTLPPPPAEPELVHVEYVENPEEEEAKRIEERRKRREALLSKLQSAPSAAPTEPLAPVAPVTPAIVSEPQQTGAQMEFSEEGEEGDAGLRTPEAKPGTATPDMFAETPMDGLEEGPGVAVNRGDNLLLAENWDDVEGYYRIQVGEQLGNRYKVFATYGKGVFSTVVKTKDSQTGQDMAIKILLRVLADKDPEDRRHLIRMTDTFEHKNHLCLVFPAMAMNLREVIKKYGKTTGLSMGAVQLLLALKHLRDCNILHADIKPDNILVNQQKNVLRLADLGSACFSEENEITPYLVSRFYRAPEIILGLRYGFPLDMWSAATTIAELYTGKILFPGRTNNQMLSLQMQIKGKFPKKILRKAQLRELHFEEDFAFIDKVPDEAGNLSIKVRKIMGPTKDLYTALVPKPNMVSSQDLEKVHLLKDLMEKMLTLDPDKRPTPLQALNHPFLLKKTPA